MRYKEVKATCYSHRLKRKVYCVLTYQVTAGPRPGIDQYFLVHKREVEEIPVPGIA